MRVVVTGGSSGIGKAVAAATMLRGDQVFLIDVDEAGVAAAASELGAVGWSRCDVADENSVETSAREGLSALGGDRPCGSRCGSFGRGSGD